MFFHYYEAKLTCNGFTNAGYMKITNFFNMTHMSNSTKNRTLTGDKKWKNIFFQNQVPYRVYSIGMDPWNIVSLVNMEKIKFFNFYVDINVFFNPAVITFFSAIRNFLQTFCCRYPSMRSTL